MHKSPLYLMVILLISLFINLANAQSDPRIGVRAGLGTDITLGLAYGVGGNYVMEFSQNSLELGLIFFGGSFEEETDEGINTYEEKTDVFVVGFMANYLINYTPGESGLFFVSGIGLASISVEWEESSPTDVSLGTPLPGGGSIQSEDGTAGGTILNLGFGSSFSSGWDIRAEFPIIVTFAPPGEASSVIPTLIATLGFRF